MSDSFYSAFEDQHRGSRALIKSRLAAYLPFVRPLASLQPPHSALDLGCGRGEWLEVLGECGFAATGIDIDDGMLAVCRQQGLSVRNADALQTLQDSPAASLTLVSAFHLVEHLPFDKVKLLIRESLRVLKPGGILVLETPNPENLVVGTSSFYRDPSHVRPIPPELLDFVVEFAGFHRHKVVRLQESVAWDPASPIDLHRVLYGVSPDYGVVSQKNAASEMLAAFDEPFLAEYGVSLGTLARHYDLQVGQRVADIRSSLNQAEDRAALQVNQTANQIASILDRLGQAEALSAQAEARSLDAVACSTQAESKALLAEARAAQAEARSAQAEALSIQAEAHSAQAEARSAQAEALSIQAEARSAQAEARSVQAEARSAQAEARSSQAEAAASQAELRSIEAVTLSSRAENRAFHAESQAAQLAAQLDAVFHSHSWRITAPLRFIALSYRRLRTAIREDRLIRGMQRRGLPLLRRLGHAVLRRPGLRQMALGILNRVPSMKYRLRNVMLDPTPLPDNLSPGYQPSPSGANPTNTTNGLSLGSPRSLRILAELKRAITARKT